MEFIAEAENNTLAIKQGKCLDDERNVKLLSILAHP
jgi:hypothetical protein